ncbi:surface polysaccharide O-acyltransferase-like enzyme [Hamadaea flava]|uniref:Acyltransferase n=1 Tax=Hamadaea flava TaxID=1742688 RepID=A0ABV8LWQ3_9ACTN|nr:acyltransferase [Hamadaea flava]MCP2327375.1 surface polysaccharide O-acyltransferase-like enzyme [Hamadaea flava]
MAQPAELSETGNVPRSRTGKTSAASTSLVDDVRRRREPGLDLLRVVAIAGVVAIHVLGPDEALQGTLHWWVATAIQRASFWAVPVFIMISGALVLNPRAHQDGPGAFYRRRLTKILPAMIAWHLVYVVGVRMWIFGEHLTLASLGSMFIESRFFTALYFLWLILGLYLLAPILVAFLRDGGERRAYIFAGVVMLWSIALIMVPNMSRLTDSPHEVYLGSLTIWLPYVGYFLAGWALRNVRLGPRGLLIATIVGVLGAAELTWQVGSGVDAPLLWALLPVEYAGPVTAVLAFCVYLVGLSIGGMIQLSAGQARVLRRLAEATFGVFLTHLLVLVLLRTWFDIVDRGTSFAVMLITYVVVLCTSFVIALAGSRIPYVRRIF